MTDARARLRQVPGRGTEELVRVLRGLRADALVLQMPDRGYSEEELGAVLDAVACPVLLVR